MDSIEGLSSIYQCFGLRCFDVGVSYMFVKAVDIKYVNNYEINYRTSRDNGFFVEFLFHSVSCMW